MENNIIPYTSSSLGTIRTTVDPLGRPVLCLKDACAILQNAFGKIKLDVVTKKGLSPYIGETILNEVEYVW